jgi:hypothetical protein
MLIVAGDTRVADLADYRSRRLMGVYYSVGDPPGWCASAAGSATAAWELHYQAMYRPRPSSLTVKDESPTAPSVAIEKENILSNTRILAYLLETRPE